MYLSLASQIISWLISMVLIIYCHFYNRNSYIYFMQTPKKFIQELYCDMNLHKNYLVKAEMKQPNFYHDAPAYATNSKAIQKISMESNSYSFKPVRDSADSKSLYFQSNLKLIKKDSDAKSMSVTQPLPPNTFFYTRDHVMEDRRLSTPFSKKNSESKGLTHTVCQTPMSKRRPEDSPLKTNDSFFKGEDSRGRRSYSSVKKNKYLTVVSRMPISKKNERISIF